MMKARLLRHLVNPGGSSHGRMLLSCVLGAAAIITGALAGSALSGSVAVSDASAARPDWSAFLPQPDPLTANSTPEQLAAKMLNTSQAYRTFSAHLVSMWDGQVVCDATVAVEQPNRFSVKANSGKGAVTATCNGDEVWIHYPNGDVEVRDNRYRLAPPTPVSDLDPEAVVVRTSGTDLPIGGAAQALLHPYSIIDGPFAAGVVQIKGVCQVGGREAVLVEVRPDRERPDDWGRKFGARRAYAVDTRTGIVLREEQFELDGTLKYRDEFVEVLIDDPDFVADFSLKLAPGERLVTVDPKLGVQPR